MRRRLVGNRPANGGALRVWLDGILLDPSPSQKVWNHSPTGFEAGYGGSGPSQLALAVLLACGFEQNYAVALHQPFKWKFLADRTLGYPMEDFTFEFDAEAWAKEREEENEKIKSLIVADQA